MIILQCCLEYRQGGSDKVYTAEIEENQGRYSVKVRYGRRGGAVVAGFRTDQPTTLNEASDIYAKTVKQKLAKGYVVKNTYTLEDTPLSTLGDVVQAVEKHAESVASFKTPLCTA